MLWKIRTDICLCLGVTFLSPNRSSVKQRIALHAKVSITLNLLSKVITVAVKYIPSPKRAQIILQLSQDDLKKAFILIKLHSKSQEK